MEYFEETISIHYISVILVFLFIFEPSFPLDKNWWKGIDDEKWRKKGREWVEEHLFIQNRWNLSQWKFYRVASETVIEWKFCSKGIKFLSIWNTSERSSRVVRVEQYRFRNVERNRIAWVCALYVVLFLPFPFFFFLLLVVFVSFNGGSRNRIK